MSNIKQVKNALQTAFTIDSFIDYKQFGTHYCGTI